MSDSLGSQVKQEVIGRLKDEEHEPVTLTREDITGLPATRHPFTCPVCGGNGMVPNGFYRQTSGQWSSGDLSNETCRSCSGSGVVWGQGEC